MSGKQIVPYPHIAIFVQSMHESKNLTDRPKYIKGIPPENGSAIGVEASRMSRDDLVLLRTATGGGSSSVNIILYTIAVGISFDYIQDI